MVEWMVNSKVDSLGKWWGGQKAELLDCWLGHMTVGMKASQKAMHLDKMKDFWKVETMVTKMAVYLALHLE